MLIFAGVAYLATTFWAVLPATKGGYPRPEMLPAGFAVGGGVAATLTGVGALLVRPLVASLRRKPAKSPFPKADGGIDTPHD